MMAKAAPTMAIDVPQHLRTDIDREQVVGVGEETYAGDEADLDVEPRRLGVVKLGQCRPAPLIEEVVRAAAPLPLDVSGRRRGVYVH